MTGKGVSKGRLGGVKRQAREYKKHRKGAVKRQARGVKTGFGK